MVGVGVRVRIRIRVWIIVVGLGLIDIRNGTGKYLPIYLSA